SSLSPSTSPEPLKGRHSARAMPLHYAYSEDLMSITESIRIALRSLAANKLRAALTMLGIIIGVGAVIALMAIGRGAEARIVSSIQANGTNLLYVSPGSTNQGGVNQGAGTATTLTLD